MAYPKNKPRRDLQGQRFGRLIVMKQTNESLRGMTVWECKCDCGNTRRVPSSALVSGNTTSCGCLTKERQRSVVALPEGEAAFNFLIKSYRQNARTKGRVFELTKDEFRKLTSSVCFYCGIKPSSVINHACFNGVYAYNGVDRIDSDKGYTTDNCVSCCKRCNRAKDNMTQQDFADLISRIFQHYVMNLSETLKGTDHV